MAMLPEDVRVIIGGSGPLTERWKDLAVSLGLGDRIHFAGLIEEAELPAWYQACDVFCLPAVSEAEAFGIVQVEAMASGKPVVSTRLNSGVKFVNRHGETGLLVQPGSVEELVAALRTLLADDELRIRLGKQARAWALQEFGLDVMGRRTKEVYEQCVLTL